MPLQLKRLKCFEVSHKCFGTPSKSAIFLIKTTRRSDITQIIRHILHLPPPLHNYYAVQNITMAASSSAFFCRYCSATSATSLANGQPVWGKMGEGISLYPVPRGWGGRCLQRPKTPSLILLASFETTRLRLCYYYYVCYYMTPFGLAAWLIF